MKLIAEIAKTHGGDISQAKKAIRIAKEAGFDAVKFQAYDKYDLLKNHDNFERYEKSWLSLETLKELKDYAKIFDLDFWVSVFSKNLIQPISTFTSVVKVPSQYLTNNAFISDCAEHFRMCHISTGFYPRNVVERQISQNTKRNTVFYHCVSQYPTEVKNLRMKRIKDFGMEGFSYHGTSTNAVIVSKLLGVKFLEIHFNELTKAKQWEWTKGSVILLRGMLNMVDEMMSEKPQTEKEVKDLDFYKKEFKELCSM